MPNVKYKYGTKDQLKGSAVTDGTIYITTDTKELAVDLDGERIYPNKENFEAMLPDTVGIIQNGDEQPEDTDHFVLWLDYTTS